MPPSSKLPYVFYTLEVDQAYWLSLRGNEVDYDAGSRYFNETVNKVVSKFPIPTQLEGGNIPSYEKGLARGIGSWLSRREYSPGLIRLYTEPKSGDVNKKRYVIAEIKGM